jgi:hypothetical protein
MSDVNSSWIANVIWGTADDALPNLLHVRSEYRQIILRRN